MTQLTFRIFLLIGLFGITTACTKSEKEGVFFPSLNDGDVVAQTFQVKFGVNGMKVSPAGELIEGTGHHHLIVNGGPIPKETVVPADSTHIHFGGGQTETELTLEPGEHSLTLQFADGAHRSYGPEWSKTIKVTVK